MTAKKLVKKESHRNTFVLFFEEENSAPVPVNVSRETYVQFIVGKEYVING